KFPFRNQMTENTQDHEILTAEEAAAYLRVSHHTVWRWCKEGRLPAFQINREWRIRRSKLEELIEELESSGDNLADDEEQG
ncbi:MAG: helix-turn-helix domain-containing protein, partial [Anaerolineae bacterium]